ncbi:MAG: 3-hydroxyacyl-CoA dehydrogenase NAD-binding domain-containing protein [Syntrophales bacterium]|nr:3-hydroxyacyl-CoA dehydrogenase NAD-binding domain-containing protein [Syntrophales bacterium]
MEIKNVSIVGLGTLGTQISVQCAAYGYNVKGYDTVSDSFSKTLEKIRATMKTTGKGPTVPIDAWEKAAASVKVITDMEECLKDADLVIEAVPEVLELKREVFTKMDKLAPKHAILATNSSSIPISRIESATNRPERCLNMHFYQPAVGFILCDIMGGTKTLPEIIETARQFIRSLDLIPLKVNKEILGFCFNSVWRAIKKHVLFLACNGYVDFRDIDRAWMVFTGMPYGPFALMDMVGLDVVYDIEMSYYNESKDPRDIPPPSFKEMIDRNELGVKTGKGFYTYPNPEWARPDFLKG